MQSDSDDGGAAKKPRRVLAIESDDEDSDTSVLPAGQQMRTAIDLTRDGELLWPASNTSTSTSTHILLLMVTSCLIIE